MKQILHAFCALVAASCTTTSSDSSHPDAGPSAGSNVVVVPVGSGAIDAIAISPPALTPAFAPAIADYYVRCGSGTNALAVTVDAGGRETSDTYSVLANQALVVGDYSIRCLPPDFPAITVATNGTPTDGYYLVNSVPYVAALDVHGTPVWYRSVIEGCELDSPAVATLSYLPEAEYPYGYDSIPNFEVHDLDTGGVTVWRSPDAPTNEHELRQLPNGDYLMFADQLTPHVDLTGLGSAGSDETIDDCKIEEIDGSGAVVWSWLGSQHIDPIKETLFTQTNVFHIIAIQDVFHCNAIDVGSNGDLLISSRHASALYDIDKATGTVQWKLGGTAYNLDGAPHLAVIDDPAGGFNLQHDARFLPNGDISLFDDHGLDGGSGSGVARGIELSLDHTAGTAQIVWQAAGSEESQYMGSFRRYADGESVIGWGYLPNENRVVSEFDAAGSDVLDISFELPTVFNALTYRAIKVPLSQLDHDVLRATSQSATTP